MNIVLLRVRLAVLGVAVRVAGLIGGLTAPETLGQAVSDLRPASGSGKDRVLPARLWDCRDQRVRAFADQVNVTLFELAVRGARCSTTPAEGGVDAYFANGAVLRLYLAEPTHTYSWASRTPKDGGRRVLVLWSRKPSRG